MQIFYSDLIPQYIKDWISSTKDDPVISIASTSYPYKFGVFSDIHLTKESYLQGSPATYLNGYNDFVLSLGCSINNGIKFFCITGDLGMSGLESETSSTSNRIVEELLFKDASSKFPTMKIHCMPGNHDAMLSDAQWKSKTGYDRCHHFTYKNELFIFIGNKKTSYMSTPQTEPYNSADLDYLENTLNANPNKRAFVFVHYPLNSLNKNYQFAGMADYSTTSSDQGRRVSGLFTSGFLVSYSGNDTWTNALNTRIINILKAYNGHVFYFSGHNHFRFLVDQDYRNVIHYELAYNVDLFHVPSLNAPRDKASNTISTSDYTQCPTLGYNVTVELNKVVVNGYEFRLCSDSTHGDIIRTYTVNEASTCGHDSSGNIIDLNGNSIALVSEQADITEIETTNLIIGN